MWDELWNAENHGLYEPLYTLVYLLYNSFISTSVSTAEPMCLCFTDEVIKKGGNIFTMVFCIW